MTRNMMGTFVWFVIDDVGVDEEVEFGFGQCRKQ